MSHHVMAALSLATAGAYLRIALRIAPRLARVWAPRTAPALVTAAAGLLVAAAAAQVVLMAVVLGDAPGALVGLPMLAAQAAQLVGAMALVWLDRRTAPGGTADAEPRAAGPRAPGEAELQEQAALGRVAMALAGGAAPADALSLVAAEAAQACGLSAGAVVRLIDERRGAVVGSWSTDGISAPPVGASVPGDEAAALDLPGTITAAVRVRGRLWGALAAAGPPLGPPAPGAEGRLAQLADLFALAISEGEATEALGASERGFGALCALSPAGVYETDAEGARTWTSQAWSEMTGLAGEDAAGTGWVRVLHPDDRARLFHECQEAAAAGAEFDARYRYRATDGRVLWVRGRSVALRDDRGAVIGRLGAVVDHTDRYLADEELRHQDSLVQAVLDAVPDALELVSARGDVLLANAAARRMLGAGGQPADAAALRAAVAELAADPHRIVRDDCRMVATDRVIQRYSTPVHIGPDPDRPPLGRLFVLRDVSDEREAERIKSDFVALASYEFRSPLTSVLGYLEAVLEGDAGELSQGQERFLGIAHRNAGRLRRLVDDVLLVARADADGLELEMDALDMADVVRECVARSEPMAAERGVGLSSSLAPAPVRGDRARLAQMVDNLISNALNLTPTGGTVGVLLSAAGSRVVVEVSDGGVGVPPADGAHAFTSFRLGVPSGGAVPGAGLGLAVARVIVEAHAGNIDVDSEGGRGSVLRVELPQLAS